VVLRPIVGAIRHPLGVLRSWRCHDVHSPPPDGATHGPAVGLRPNRERPHRSIIGAMATERTVRLLAQSGAIRRRSSRRLTSAEESYVEGHGQLLAGLRSALRTERSLRTVVLFGSVARGDDRADSDIDLAVAPAPSRLVAERFRARVGAATGRGVDLIDWRAAQLSADLAPRLLREGRPLRDADGEWSHLEAQRRNVMRRGRRREAAWAELERRVLG
jgi:predicted nucleotidyltransferase